MFDENLFIEYCKERYTQGLGQDDAHAFWNQDTYDQTQDIRNICPLQLTIWLGEYLTNGKD